MNIHNIETIIHIVKGQTNYTEDEIKEKLIQHKNNYIDVIKEYMNITDENAASVKYNEQNLTRSSVNQNIYAHIRQFMDHKHHTTQDDYLSYTINKSPDATSEDLEKTTGMIKEAFQTYKGEEYECSETDQDD